MPFVSLVDAGTVELVKGFGHRVVSSADLVQTFVSTIDEDGYQLHKEAGRIIDRVLQEAFEQIRSGVESRSGITDYDVQQFILRRQTEQGLVTSTPPLVGINERPADPHFELKADKARKFSRGDTVLIDLYGKKNVPGAIYYDITWVAVVGSSPPPEYQRFSASPPTPETPRSNSCRITSPAAAMPWLAGGRCLPRLVVRGGYGEYFVHRTGHSMPRCTAPA